MTSDTDAESIDADVESIDGHTESLQPDERCTLPKTGGPSPGSDVLQAKLDDLVGLTLRATYKVDSVLGQGGMGRVYRARHTRVSSKFYAIKVLHREFCADPNVLARFRREAEAAATITHPNVVGVYDVDRTTDGQPYIVCEYLAGKDLAELLRARGKLDVETAIHIALQVCAGVEAAHLQGVIHRDLKPQNVFLIADGTGELPPRPLVKILDFGLSRFLDGGSSELTRAGVIMGTPAYMAPEQARGERADHRLDVYGIGTMLYTVLSGRLPFNEQSPQATILAVLRQSPTPIRTLEPEVPETLAAVIERAMAKLPDERFASVSELREALERFAVTQSAAESGRPSSSEPASATVAVKPSVGAAPLSEVAPQHVPGHPRMALIGTTVVAALVVAGGAALVGLGAPWPFPRLGSSSHLYALLVAGLFGVTVPGAVFWWWGAAARSDASVTRLRRRLGRSVLAALVTFALGAMAARLFGLLASAPSPSPWLEPARVRSWYSWDFVLGIAVLAAALVEGIASRLEASKRSGVRVAGGLVRGGGALAVVALFGWAVEQSRVAEGANLAAASQASPAASEEPATATPRFAPMEAESALVLDLDAPESVSLPAAGGRRATSDELKSAVDAGEAELVALAARYPEDPAVLRALAVAYASRAGGLPDTMRVLKRLFSIEPSMVRDAGFRYFVARAAETPGDAADLAFDVLANDMGASGPDLLYELLLRSKSSDRALSALRKPALRRKFTPRLAIAFDLRTAEGCTARLPLLKRAALEGDERSIIVLAALSSGTRRGCGKWKRQPCKPACEAEAPAFRDTIKKISARLNESRR